MIDATRATTKVALLGLGWVWSFFTASIAFAVCGGDPRSILQGPPARLSETGIFEELHQLKSCPHVVEYFVNSPLWSDGAEKRRWIILPVGGKIQFHEQEPWVFPIGTILVKQFELPRTPLASVRVETRFLIHKQQGEWVGFTYRWNEDQRDATLLSDSVDQVYQTPRPQRWTFPSPAMCLQCHQSGAGFVLGVRSEQLNRTVPGSTENQLERWSRAGFFSNKIPYIAELKRYVTMRDGAVPLEARVRSYLAVNCAHCHQPGSSVRSEVDFRFSTPLISTHTVNAPANLGDMDLDDPLIIKAGDKTSSVLWLRMQSPTTRHMPFIGSNVPDQSAIDEVGHWIDQMAPSQ